MAVEASGSEFARARVTTGRKVVCVGAGKQTESSARAVGLLTPEQHSESWDVRFK